MQTNDFSSNANNVLPVVAFFEQNDGFTSKLMSSVIDSLSSEMSDNMLFEKIDTNKKPELSKKYEIADYPTTIIFKENKEVERISGIATKEYLKRILEQF